MTATEFQPPKEFTKWGDKFELVEAHPSNWCIYLRTSGDKSSKGETIQYFETFQWRKGTLNGVTKYGIASSLWGIYGFTNGPFTTAEGQCAAFARAKQHFNDKTADK